MNRSFFIIPIVFFLCLIPFAATLIQYYPDEWHYINAALMMQQGGDYWTPHNMGEPLLRLNKPILTYWAVLGGFKLLGVQVVGLRFFFLVAGCLTVVLTGWIARSLFLKNDTAILAMLILMTQSPFLLSSVRAIPDILLVLFLTLSAAGLIRLLVKTPDRFGLNWWCFYWGAALAIESKGFLPVLFLIISWIFLWVFQRQVFRQNRFSHFLAAATALVVAGGWYLLMFFQHGNLFFQAFFHDQIGVRVHHAFWLPLINIPLAALLVVLGLLPWSLMAIRGTVSMNRNPVFLWIVAWSAILILVVGFGANVSSRYLLPLAPLWAVLIAGGISRMDALRQRRLGRYGLMGVSILFFIVGVISFSIGAQLISLGVGMILFLAFFAVSFLIYLGVRRDWFHSGISFGLALFFFYVSLFLPVSLMALPEKSQQIVNALDVVMNFPKKSEPVSLDFIGLNRLAAEIRLVSQERYYLNYLAASGAKLNQSVHFPLLISEKNARFLKLPSDKQKKIVLSHSLINIPPTDFLSGLITGNLEKQIQNHQEEYWLITEGVSVIAAKSPSSRGLTAGSIELGKKLQRSRGQTAG